MLNGMSEDQFQEWRAYAELEPFGPLELFWAAATVRHTVACANGAKNVKVQDFYPDFAGDFKPRDQSSTELDTVLRGWVEQAKQKKA